MRVSFLDPTNAQAAFSSGKLDAWATWDPFSALLETKRARKITDATGISKGLSFVDTNENALADPGKRVAIADFLERQNKAQQWATENPEKNIGLLEKLTGQPRESLRIAQRRSTGVRLVPADRKVVADLQEVADRYVEFGVLPDKFDVSPYFVRDPA